MCKCFSISIYIFTRKEKKYQRYVIIIFQTIVKNCVNNFGQLLMETIHIVNKIKWDAIRVNTNQFFYFAIHV
jgi:hypothetical protein